MGDPEQQRLWPLPLTLYVLLGKQDVGSAWICPVLPSDVSMPMIDEIICNEDYEA